MKKLISVMLSIALILNLSVISYAFDIFYQAAGVPVINSVTKDDVNEVYIIDFTSSLSDAEAVRLATYDAIKDFIGGEDKLLASDYKYLAAQSKNYILISFDAEEYAVLGETDESSGAFTLMYYDDILTYLKDSTENMASFTGGFSFYVKILTASENYASAPASVFVYAESQAVCVSADAFGFIEYVLPGNVSNPRENTVFFAPPLKEDIKLKSPSRNGYQFYGWENEEGKFIGKIPAGVSYYKVYARWYPMTYEINYFLTTHYDPDFNYSFGRADNSKNPVEYTVGSPVTITDIASPVPGFSFGGWYYEPDFSGERVREITAEDTGVKLLYAKWISEKDTQKDLEEVRREFIENGHFGDVDNDSAVTSADARLVLRYVVGLEDLSAAFIKRADYTGSGKISSADARTTLRISVGLDDIYDILLENGVLPDSV